jgi:hypothetical protein
MKKIILFFLQLLCVLSPPSPTKAQIGSGIVVDQMKMNIYIVFHDLSANGS